MTVSSGARKAIISLFTLAVIFSTTLFFDLTQSFYKNYSLAVHNFKAGNYDKSTAFLLTALEIEPKNPDAQALLLWSYEKLGMRAKAKDVLASLLTLNPDDVSIKEQLADAYYGLLDYEQAESFYSEIIKRGAKKEVRKKLAEVLIWQKKYDTAIPILEDLLEKNKKNLDLAELLADVYSWAKYYEKAIDLYQKLLSSKHKTDDVTLKLADTLRHAGRNDEAIQIYNQYLRKER